MARAIRSTKIFSPRSARMPAASGIALGFDRLVMLATGASRIDQVLWTPPVDPPISPALSPCLRRGGPAEGPRSREWTNVMRSTKRTLRSAAQLQASGLIPAEQVAELEKVAARYAVALTPAMAGLIDPADANDPIARQFIPDAAELVTKPEERADPIGDDAHSPVEGIVHRYPDRVLLKLVHVCAVYCRFCFRREMVGPGQTHALTPTPWNRRWLISVEHRGNLGSHPDRRRSAGAVAATAGSRHEATGGHRPREGAAHCIRACRCVDPGRMTPALVRAITALRQGRLCGAARQSSARADAGGARAPARGLPMPAFRCSVSRCC